MGSYEILSIGTKLKNLREKYNVNQEDISGKEITRNLISQIEHDKANLTKNAAEIILKNLKIICDKRHISVDEDIEYLMEDEKSQANKILDKYIKELKDLSIYKDNAFDNKLSEVESFLINWDIKDKKISIFELAGDYYCAINNLEKSLLYYEKARTLIDINNYTDNFVSILRKLSMIYFYMDKYEDNIKCCNFAIKNFKNMSKDYYCIFIYNSALCYIKLKNYSIALKRFIKIENIVKEINIEKYYSVLNQEACCFGEMHEYEKSLELNNYILANINKTNYQSYLVALINLTYNYIDINNNIEAKKVLNTIDETINNLTHDSKYLPDTYFEIGKIYKRLNETEKAENFYCTALTYAKKLNRNSLVKDILLNLMDTCKFSKDNRKVITIKNEFFILSGKIGKVIEPLEDKLIEFYLDTEDIQSLKELYAFKKRLSLKRM
ncbi:MULTISPECIES: helix-turn-helix domain-containing protein [Clostridium]|uniref:helix-turn-helix domain-containing protein n=1 Tax=Clostridium TaxID=1485 RepID=UPI0008243124|nr:MULTISPECIES: helix-turn-helix transcriptional regulator [Clostridium]PJI06546.1 XRE family transcriptional regulator [Clostridium sp. CT7]